MKRARPILIFDSGVGGLSVLEHVRRALPKAPIVYAADNGGFPYGTRSEAEIAVRVPTLLGRLSERYSPRIIVIACNTASTIALDTVRRVLAVPVIGTVPAIKPAALATKTKVIGVLGTEATVRQPYVDRLSAEFASDCLVIRHGSPDLVTIAEAKMRGIVPIESAMESALSGIFSQPNADRMDQLVLACTHFPLLSKEIAAMCPANIALVDSGAGIARRTAELLQNEDWTEFANGRAVFSLDDGRQDLLRPALEGYGITEIDFL